jgi:hypothetical protein
LTTKIDRYLIALQEGIKPLLFESGVTARAETSFNESSLRGGVSMNNNPALWSLLKEHLKVQVVFLILLVTESLLVLVVLSVLAFTEWGKNRLRNDAPPLQNSSDGCTKQSENSRETRTKKHGLNRK